MAEKPSGGGGLPRNVDVRGNASTFADAAYKYILNGILQHELKPGHSLRAKDLAGLMGISPTPVERALERLAGEGLVEFRPGKGPFVAEPTAAEILELFGVQLMLELYAVQQGIERVDDSFLAEMERLMRTHEEASSGLDDSFDSRRALVQAGREVHSHVMSLWPNHKAQAWHRQVNVQLRSFQLVSQVGRRRRESIAEHRALYEALKRKDLAAALAAVRQHITESRESFLARARAAGLAS